MEISSYYVFGVGANSGWLKISIRPLHYFAAEPWKRLRPDFEAQARGAADDSNAISPARAAIERSSGTLD
jgi:hypothetical protein